MLSDRTRTKTKAAEIEHAIRHHLDVDLDDDPDLQASFAEALAEIFEEFRTTGTRSTRSWKNFGTASSTPAKSRPMGCTAKSKCLSFESQDERFMASKT